MPDFPTETLRSADRGTCPPLMSAQKWFMLGMLLRDGLTFERARNYLQPRHFSEWEDRVLQVVWSAALRALCKVENVQGRQFQYVPTLEAVEAEALAELQLLGHTQLMQEVRRFLQYALSLSLDQSNLDLALALLHQFLQHKTADEVVRQLSSPNRPDDLFRVLDQHVRRIEQLRYGLSRPTVQEAIPEDLDDDEDYAPPEPTTLFLFNVFMGGGDRVGDLHGILGPWGGGKTTCLIQHGVDRAARYLSEWLSRDRREPLGLVYYFAYEDPLYDLRMRMASCRGEISLTNLRKGRPENVLLREGYADYERRRFGALIESGQFLPEYSRYQLARNGLNWNFRLFGMGGQDKRNPNWGGGLVREIRQIIRDDSDAWSAYLGCETVPRLILIDFLGAALSRYFSLHGNARRAREEFTFQAQMFMVDAKQSLANAMRTAVYVAHQYSGEANRKSRAIYPDHTDSAGFKAFSQHTDYTICFGAIPEGDERQLFVAKIDKHRKAPPRPELICHLDGDFSRIREPDDNYVFDHISRQIVRQSETSQLVDLPISSSNGPSLLGLLPGRRYGFS